MRRAALLAVALAVGGCSTEVEYNEPKVTETTSTTLHLPERLPDLLPVARQVLSRGEPAGGAAADELLRTCIALRRAVDAARATTPGSSERGTLDDAQLAKVAEAGSRCARDPAGAAALLP